MVNLSEWIWDLRLLYPSDFIMRYAMLVLIYYLCKLDRGCYNIFHVSDVIRRKINHEKLSQIQ